MKRSANMPSVLEERERVGAERSCCPMCLPSLMLGMAEGVGDDSTFTRALRTLPHYNFKLPSGKCTGGFLASPCATSSRTLRGTPPGAAHLFAGM